MGRFLPFEKQGTVCGKTMFGDCQSWVCGGGVGVVGIAVCPRHIQISQVAGTIE